MNENWSQAEVEATVADYFEMLSLERLGQTYNKTEHRKALARVLNGRSEGAIEFKHCNISACLVDLGFPAYILGYRPRSNYQEALLKVVADHLLSNDTLRELVRVQAEQVPDQPFPKDILNSLVEPPAREKPSGVSLHGVVRDRISNVVDYAARDERNRALGERGERFVLAFEQARLVHEGVPKLADRVEQVSKTKGDGLGYDILSFEVDGSERFIEVKATNFQAYAPFYVSRNELRVSQEKRDRYFLYRTFAFREDPRLFTLQGPLDRTVDLQIQQYIARVH